jgi:hypothetical protein
MSTNQTIDEIKEQLEQANNNDINIKLIIKLIHQLIFLMLLL